MGRAAMEPVAGRSCGSLQILLGPQLANTMVTVYSGLILLGIFLVLWLIGVPMSSHFYLHVYFMNVIWGDRAEEHQELESSLFLWG